MPTVSSTPTNTFYIAANIIFELDTGTSKQVLMLVNKREDATVFNSTDAQNYLNFVKQRARGIVWVVEQLPTFSPLANQLFQVPQEPPDCRFVIKGMQYV